MESRADGRTSRHAHRRPELLNLAAAYLLDHGISRTSMRPLAAHLDISHATLLHHFRSRQQLLTEVVDFIASQELSALASLTSVTNGDVVEVARTLWARYSEPHGQATLRLMFEAVGLTAVEPEVFKPLATRMIKVWREPLIGLMVGLGASEGLLEPFATLAIAQFRGLQMELIATGDAERMDAAFDIWLDQMVALMGPAARKGDI